MVRAEEAEAELGELLGGLTVPDDWREQVMAQVEEAFGSPQDVVREERRIKLQMEKLSTLFQVTEMTEVEFKRRYEQLKLELLSLQPPELPDLEQGAELLKDFGSLWAAATEEEQRELAHTLLDVVYLDVEDGPITAIRPRPEFVTLFALSGEHEIREGNLIVLKADAIPCE
jgi:hypothetical protein